ncbi:hypothetical protein VOLCADRAFT_95614 [Volvox carteri f. nagariensis]|uniref:RING-type E3 ubiquitin transferase n=1 Tax=Volvox carteri f. nagariensis TaxID=3068 RepID=D8U830_VOLCA|nr:uncharacterized protein VOLCADRAFT_95614 [Volvox carteri f. nagariensis]EFJ44146.1 hypothetical protein VOLCADRAFT_95614 [Volvox carteri f. nagariensis]|eukprot:XP_002954740.1 hypothetical protein VOLCADRAFT_95614 [Volvox carteri f. nagariensis]
MTHTLSITSKLLVRSSDGSRAPSVRCNMPGNPNSSPCCSTMVSRRASVTPPWGRSTAAYCRWQPPRPRAAILHASITPHVTPGEPGKDVRREGEPGKDVRREGEPGKDVRREGEPGKDVRQEGEPGKDVRREGEPGKDVRREGEPGKDVRQEGEPGKDVRQEGEPGKDVRQEGEPGKDVRREGEPGKDVRREGEPGKDVRREAFRSGHQVVFFVGPYVADRLAGRLDSAAEEEEGTAAEGAAAAAAAVSAATDATGGSYPDEDAAAAAAEDLRQVSGREAGRGPGSVAITTASAASAAAAATRLGVGARSGDGGGGGGGGEGGAPSGRGWLRVFLAAVVARWSRSWRRLVLSWPQLRRVLGSWVMWVTVVLIRNAKVRKPLLSYSGRLHLALFYTYGAYYSLAHRLAGVRYSLSMRPLQGVLGVLLGLQLAVVAALQARNALRNMRRRSTAAVAAAAAATKRRTARRRQRPGAQGPGRLSGDGAGDEEGEEHLYSAEGEPAVFLEDEDGEEEEDGESDEAYQEEAEAEEGMERDGPTGSGQQPAGDSGVDTGRRGGEEARRRGLGDWSSGSSAGGVAVVMEGWEGVERQDDGGESGWEADIFGVASMSTSVQRQGPCVEKPECPLCRTAVRLPQLIRSPFPFCACNRTLPGLVPFNFDKTPSLSLNGDNRRYCLTLRTVPCADPSSPCCGQALSKVEWWSRESCRGSVRAVYLDGIKIDSQWGVNGTFKIPQLNMAPSSVPLQGRQVCLELLSTSTCPTLATFCAKGGLGACTYSMFSEDKDCCPIGTFVTLGRR